MPADHTGARIRGDEVARRYYSEKYAALSLFELLVELRRRLSTSRAASDRLLREACEAQGRDGYGHIDDFEAVARSYLAVDIACEQADRLFQLVTSYTARLPVYDIPAPAAEPEPRLEGVL